MPATSGAASLVFIKDHNVWLSQPDGSGQYQVTTNGTAGDPWESPSQADDGTIFAVRGSGSDELIYRLRQNGELVGAPFEPAVEFALGVLSADVSPDGSKIAYYTGFVGDNSCQPDPSGTKLCYTLEVSSTAGPASLGGEPNGSFPSWIGSSRVLFNYPGALATLAVGGSAQQWWLFNEPPFLFISSPELTRAGDRLAAVVQGSETELWLYTTNGPPPAGPGDPANEPTPRCGFSGPAGTFKNPGWSPDGGTLAWEESDDNADIQGEGVWTASVGALTSGTCDDLGEPALRVPAATEPDWGPADVNPGPRPGPGPGPAPVCCSPPPDRTRPVISASLAAAPRLAKAVKSGFDVTVATNEPGRATIIALASGRDGRGLDPFRSAAGVAARGSKQLTAAGRHKVRVRFTKKAKRKFRRRHKALKLTLRIAVNDRAGNTASLTRKVKLKR